MIENRTSTPWTGETVNGIYQPGQREIWSRAAELRNQRGRVNEFNPSVVIPEVSFEDVEAEARRDSRFECHRRG